MTEYIIGMASVHTRYIIGVDSVHTRAARKAAEQEEAHG